MTRTPPPASAGSAPAYAAGAPRLDGLVERSTASALELDTTPPRQLADEVVVLFAVVNRLHAMALARLARVDAHGVAALESGSSTASWLRHHTGLPSGQASDLVRTARSLRSSFPRPRARFEAARSPSTTPARSPARRGWSRTSSGRRGRGRRRPSPTSSRSCSTSVVRSTPGSLAGFATRVRQVVDPEGALADANRAHERRWLSTVDHPRRHGEHRRRCSTPRPAPWCSRRSHRQRHRGGPTTTAARASAAPTPWSTSVLRPRHRASASAPPEFGRTCW